MLVIVQLYIFDCELFMLICVFVIFIVVLFPTLVVSVALSCVFSVFFLGLVVLFSS